VFAPLPSIDASSVNLSTRIMDLNSWGSHCRLATGEPKHEMLSRNKDVANKDVTEQQRLFADSSAARN